MREGRCRVSAYTDRVDRNAAELRFLSCGISGGCDQCREPHHAYRPIDDLEQEQETWIVPAAPGVIFASEDEATLAARAAFDAAVSSGKVPEDGSFSHYGCGFCGQGGTSVYVYHWVDDQDRIQHGDDICGRCVRYLVNGEVGEA